MTTINNARTPWQDIQRAGIPWHGHEASGQLYNRLDGQLITLPAEVAYNRADTGENRLLDFGLPAIDTTPAEAAAGMMWWEKGVFNGAARYLNPVRGTAASSIQLLRTAWLYRCADGTVYSLNYDESSKKIYCLPVTVPQANIPSSGSSGTVVADLSALVFPATYVAPDILPTFVNFAPNGSKAALHFVRIEYAFSAYYVRTDAIAEVSVTAGSVSAVPIIELTRYRIREDGGSSSATDALFYTDEIISMPAGLGDSTGALYNGWGHWPSAYGGPNPTNYGYAGWNGTYLHRYREIHSVDYNVLNEPIDIGRIDESEANFTGSITTLANGREYLQADGHYRITRYLSAGSIHGKYYEKTFDVIGIWAEQWADYFFSSPSNTVIFGAESNIARIGNLVVASIEKIQFNAIGDYAATPVDVRGVACAKAVTCSGSSLGSINPNSLAMDPVTGVFNSGISRYF